MTLFNFSVKSSMLSMNTGRFTDKNNDIKAKRKSLGNGDLIKFSKPLYIIKKKTTEIQPKPKNINVPRKALLFEKKTKRIKLRIKLKSKYPNFGKKITKNHR